MHFILVGPFQGELQVIEVTNKQILYTRIDTEIEQHVNVNTHNT